MFSSCYCSPLELFLPQVLSPEVKEPKTRPVVQSCSPAEIFVLAIYSWVQSWRESEGGLHGKQKKSKRSPRHWQLRLPGPHPTCVLGISGPEMLASRALILKMLDMLGLALGTRLPSWCQMRSQAGVWGNMDSEVARLGVSPHAD